MDERILRPLNSLLRNFRKIDPRWNSVKLPLCTYRQVQELPVMTRQDLLGFSARYGLREVFHAGGTSGSTSARLLIGHSRAAYRAHVRRLSELYGRLPVPRGSVCLNLCSYDINGGGRLMETGYKQAGIGVVPLSVRDIREHGNELRTLVKAFRPNMVNAYANQLYGLFPMLGKDHRIRVCVVNGEPLAADYKAMIERTAGVLVFDHYGAMEVSGLALAVRSTDTMMKAAIDGLILEVLRDDGRTALSGEGALLVTDLYNRSLPVIRYRLGDRVRLVRRTNGLFMKILGRESGSILIDGEVYVTGEIERAAADVVGHLQFYFIIRKAGLTGRDALTLRIAGAVDGIALEKVRGQLLKRFRFAQTLRIESVQGSVPRTSTGKVRHIMDLRGRAA